MGLPKSMRYEFVRQRLGKLDLAEPGYMPIFFKYVTTLTK